MLTRCCRFLKNYGFGGFCRAKLFMHYLIYSIAPWHHARLWFGLPQRGSNPRRHQMTIFHDSNLCYGAGHFFRSAPRLLKSRRFRLRLLKSRRFRLRLFFGLKMLSELPRIVSFILTIVKYVNITNIALNINTVHCINNIRKQKPAPAFAKPTRGLLSNWLKKSFILWGVWRV